MVEQILDDTCLFTMYSGGFRAVYEITHLCDYGCRHCSVDAGMSAKEQMNTQEVIDSLTNLVDAGLKSVYISGGEPLMRPDLLDILNKATQFIDSSKINIASNGKMMTKEIASSLAKTGLGSVLISLDGHNPETAFAFRGVEGCYEMAINALSTLSAEGVKTRLGVVIWQGNYNSLEEFIKIGIETGADNVFYNWMVPIGRANHNNDLLLSPSMYFDISRKIKELKNKYHDVINVGFHRFNTIYPESLDCQAGESILHVLPSGKIAPCSWLYKSNPDMLSSGSLKDTPLKVLLEEPIFEKIMNIKSQRLQEGHGPGCLAMCQIYNGNLVSKDPLYRDGGAWQIFK